MKKRESTAKKSIILVMLVGVLFLTGCPSNDTDILLGEDYYFMGWVLHNPDDNTPTTLSYTKDEMAVYNITHNIPGYGQQFFGLAEIFLEPYHKNHIPLLLAEITPLAAPNTKIYHLGGNAAPSDQYGSNWSFYTKRYLNHILADDQFAYAFAQEEWYPPYFGWDGEWLDALPIVPGAYEEAFFGTSPYIPTSFTVEKRQSEGIVLRTKDELLRGNNGKTIKKIFTSVVTSGDYGAGLQSPIWTVYKDGQFFGQIGLNNWDVAFDSFRFFDDGLYESVLVIPAYSPTFNMTVINASFSTFEDDVQPPFLEKIVFPPKFSKDDSIPISVEVSDNDAIEEVNLSYGVDGVWNQLSLTNDGNVWSTSLTITDDDVETIDFRIAIKDPAQNSIRYDIYPISNKERTVSLNLNLNTKTQVVTRGQELSINGQCTDEKGDACAFLRLQFALNNEPIGVGYTLAQDIDYTDQSILPAGRFSFSHQVPFDYIEPKLNFSVQTESTGAYVGVREELSVDLTIYDHDVAISSIDYGTLVYGLSSDIDVTVFNIGNNDAEDLELKLVINRDIVARTTIPKIEPGKSMVVRLPYIPQIAGFTLLEFEVTYDKDEFYDNNQKTIGSVIDISGVDISARFLSIERINVGQDNMIPLSIENEGDMASGPIAIEIVSSDDFYFTSLDHNLPAVVSIGGKDYSIISKEFEARRGILNVTYDGINEEFKVYEGELVELDNGTFITLEEVSSRGVFIALVKGKKHDAIPIGSVEAGQSLDVDFHFNPDHAGKYIFFGFADVAEDVRWGNNFAPYQIAEAVPEGPDVTVWLDAPYRMVVGQSNEIEIQYKNRGTTAAENVMGYLYNLYDFNSFTLQGINYFEMRDSNVVVELINRTNETAEVNISRDGVQETIVLELINPRKRIYALQDDFYFFFNRLSKQNDISYYYGKGVLEQTFDLGTVAVQGEDVLEYDFTPLNENRNQLLLFFMESKEDVVWDDNYVSAWLDVIQDGPDLRPSFLNYWRDIVVVNQSKTFEFEIRNEGIKTSQKANVSFYYLPPFLIEVIPIDAIIEEPEPVKEEAPEVTQQKGTQSSVEGDDVQDLSKAYLSKQGPGLLSEDKINIITQALEDEWIFISRDAIDPLQPEESVEFSINITPNQTGSYLIRAIVNTSEDVDIDNNDQEYFFISRSEGVDVVVDAYLFDRPKIGIENEIIVIVRNIGSQTTQNVKLAYFDNGVKFAEETIDEVTPWGYYWYSEDWTPTTFRHNITVIATATDDIDNENNVQSLDILIPQIVTTVLSIEDSDGNPAFLNVILGDFSGKTSSAQITVDIPTSVILTDSTDDYGAAFIYDDSLLGDTSTVVTDTYRKVSQDDYYFFLIKANTVDWAYEDVNVLVDANRSILEDPSRTSPYGFICRTWNFKDKLCASGWEQFADRPDFYDDETISFKASDEKIEAIAIGSPDIDHDRIPDLWDADTDNDGVDDFIDNLICDPDFIKRTEVGDISIRLDNGSDISNSDKVSRLRFDADGKQLFAFDFDFSKFRLHCFGIEVHKQAATHVRGAVSIRNLDLRGGTKTVHVDRIAETDEICIIDEEQANISELTLDCSGGDELPLSCPGSDGSYSCSIENDQYVVSGLRFTVVGETAGWTEDWSCGVWSNCVGGMQTRQCQDNNGCGTENNKPLEEQSCSGQVTGQVDIPSQGTGSGGSGGGGGGGFIVRRQCNDNVDNDKDGLIDFDGNGDVRLKDPDCSSFFDDIEGNVLALEEPVITAASPEDVINQIEEAKPVTKKGKTEKELPIIVEREKPSLLSFLIGLVVAVIVVAAYLFSHRPGIPPKYAKDVQQYIDTQREKGFSDKQIRERLKAQGWKKSMLGKLFKK